jgi:UPF0042 nucleotide-binding protein
LAESILIVTGLSGAGKTQVSKILEDTGYYNIDNIPPQLIPKFAEIASKLDPPRKISVVTDVRAEGTFGGIFECLQELDRLGIPYRILFVYADPEVLERRYSTTRRRHPLSGTNRSIRDAIDKEQALMRPVFERADLRIDTSNLSLTQLKTKVLDLIGEGDSDGMSLYLESFGYKFGIPTDSDVVFDVRCLPNPFYIDALRDHTGLDEDVRKYVMSTKNAVEFVSRLTDFIKYALPLYRREGKSQLLIAFGCTGGRHRSVSVCEIVKERLEEAGYTPRVVHRDIDR